MSKKTNNRAELTCEMLCKKKRFSEAVVKLVHDRDYVTFTEIQQMLETHMTVNGDSVMMFGKADRNLVLWANMSDEFFKLIDGMVSRKEVYLHPADVLTYFIDGGALRLPIAKGAGPYKKLHWVPSCFRVVPQQPPKKKNPKAKHPPK